MAGNINKFPNPKEEKKAFEKAEAERIIKELNAYFENVREAGGGRLFDDSEKLTEAIARRLPVLSIPSGVLYVLTSESLKPSEDPIRKVLWRALQLYNESFEQGGM